jgi:hypothetical protein
VPLPDRDRRNTALKIEIIINSNKHFRIHTVSNATNATNVVIARSDREIGRYYSSISLL